MARANRQSDFRLYVVIDNRTFSSAMRDATAFKTSDLTRPGRPVASAPAPPVATADRAVSKRGCYSESPSVFTIGEPTGGQPSGYGVTRPFTLPGSGLAGQYSTRFIPACDARC